VWIIADFTSPPELWQRLGDGYRVDAHFVLWHGDDVLQVPASSLFRHKDGWALFVVENGRARRREVSVGQRNALYAQILDGVAEGVKVSITRATASRTGCGWRGGGVSGAGVVPADLEMADRSSRRIAGGFGNMQRNCTSRAVGNASQKIQRWTSTVQSEPGAQARRGTNAIVRKRACPVCQDRERRRLSPRN
jgi:hypothetical protein